MQKAPQPSVTPAQSAAAPTASTADPRAITISNFKEQVGQQKWMEALHILAGLAGGSGELNADNIEALFVSADESEAAPLNILVTAADQAYCDSQISTQTETTELLLFAMALALQTGHIELTMQLFKTEMLVAKVEGKFESALLGPTPSPSKKKDVSFMGTLIRGLNQSSQPQTANAYRNLITSLLLNAQEYFQEQGAAFSIQTYLAQINDPNNRNTIQALYEGLNAKATRASVASAEDRKLTPDSVSRDMCDTITARLQQEGSLDSALEILHVENNFSIDFFMYVINGDAEVLRQLLARFPNELYGMTEPGSGVNVFIHAACFAPAPMLNILVSSYRNWCTSKNIAPTELTRIGHDGNTFSAALSSNPHLNDTQVNAFKYAYRDAKQQHREQFPIEGLETRPFEEVIPEGSPYRGYYALYIDDETQVQQIQARGEQLLHDLTSDETPAEVRQHLRTQCHKFDEPHGLGKVICEVLIASPSGILQRFNEAGIDLAQLNGTGTDANPLHIIAMCGNGTAAMYLMNYARGEESLLNHWFSAKTKSVGNSALHLACANDDPSVIAALLDFMPDQTTVFEQDTNGGLPIHTAFSCGNWEVATQLLSFLDQKNPSQQLSRDMLFQANVEGLTPLDHAFDAEDLSVTQLVWLFEIAARTEAAANSVAVEPFDIFLANIQRNPTKKKIDILHEYLSELFAVATEENSELIAERWYQATFIVTCCFDQAADEDSMVELSDALHEIFKLAIPLAKSGGPGSDWHNTVTTAPTTMTSEATTAIAQQLVDENLADDIPTQSPREVLGENSPLLALFSPIEHDVPGFEQRCQDRGELLLSELANLDGTQKEFILHQCLTDDAGLARVVIEFVAWGPEDAAARLTAAEVDIFGIDYREIKHGAFAEICVLSTKPENIQALVTYAQSTREFKQIMNAADQQGCTALHRVCDSEQHSTAIEILLPHCDNKLLARQRGDGASAMHLAVLRGKINVALAILNRAFQIDSSGNLANSLLQTGYGSHSSVINLAVTHQGFNLDHLKLLIDFDNGHDNRLTLFQSLVLAISNSPTVQNIRALQAYYREAYKNGLDDLYQKLNQYDPALELFSLLLSKPEKGSADESNDRELATDLTSTIEDLIADLRVYYIKVDRHVAPDEASKWHDALQSGESIINHRATENRIARRVHSIFVEEQEAEEKVERENRKKEKRAAKQAKIEAQRARREAEAREREREQLDTGIRERELHLMQAEDEASKSYRDHLVQLAREQEEKAHQANQSQRRRGGRRNRGRKQQGAADSQPRQSQEQHTTPAGAQPTQRRKGRTKPAAQPAQKPRQPQNAVPAKAADQVNPSANAMPAVRGAATSSQPPVQRRQARSTARRTRYRAVQPQVVAPAEDQQRKPSADGAATTRTEAVVQQQQQIRQEQQRESAAQTQHSQTGQPVAAPPAEEAVAPAQTATDPTNPTATKLLKSLLAINTAAAPRAAPAQPPSADSEAATTAVSSLTSADATEDEATQIQAAQPATKLQGSNSRRNSEDSGASSSSRSSISPSPSVVTETSTSVLIEGIFALLKKGKDPVTDLGILLGRGLPLVLTVDAEGYTLMHRAVQSQAKSCIALLLQPNTSFIVARANTQLIPGTIITYPLHLAAAGDESGPYVDIIEMILQAMSAYKDKLLGFTDSLGKTAYDIAAERNADPKLLDKLRGPQQQTAPQQAAMAQASQSRPQMPMAASAAAAPQQSVMPVALPPVAPQTSMQAHPPMMMPRPPILPLPQPQPMVLVGCLTAAAMPMQPVVARPAMTTQAPQGFFTQAQSAPAQQQVVHRQPPPPPEPPPTSQQPTQPPRIYCVRQSNGNVLWVPDSPRAAEFLRQTQQGQQQQPQRPQR